MRPDIKNKKKEGPIKAFFNSHIKSITPRAVTFATPEGEMTIENDYVLAMTGYQPPFQFMSACGITFQDDPDHTPVYNEQTMESNVPALYLAGVVGGGLKTNKWFIENSRVHAKAIVQHIQSRVQ